MLCDYLFSFNFVCGCFVDGDCGLLVVFEFICIGGCDARFGWCVSVLIEFSVRCFFVGLFCFCCWLIYVSWFNCWDVCLVWLHVLLLEYLLVFYISVVTGVTIMIAYLFSFIMLVCFCFGWLVFIVFAELLVWLCYWLYYGLFGFECWYGVLLLCFCLVYIGSVLYVEFV